MDMNTAVSLLNIKEDLLDDKVSSFEISHKSEGVNSEAPNGKVKQTRSKRIKNEINTFEKLLTAVTKKLDCTTNELTAWLNAAPNTPEIVQLNALRLISKHELDPFSDEISVHKYEDGRWQAFITFYGWSKLINSHPAFSGISFTESTELVGGIPAWMGCAIYRNDRVIPIEVKEYLCEIQTEHSLWKDMPRRMLRYRVIAQCARLAFGVSVPENIKATKLAKRNAELITKGEESKKGQMENLKLHLIGNQSK